MTNETCINARMIANEKDTTNRWVYLALYHHLNADNSPVDGRRGCKAGRRLSQPTAHSGSKFNFYCQNVNKCQTTIWQKIRVWLNILKHRCWLKSDVLTSLCVGDNSHKTLTLPVDLAHLLPRPPRCHPEQVVVLNLRIFIV